MSIRTIVDVPELKDIKTITLSYTFFPIDGEKPVAAADQAAGEQQHQFQTEANLGG